MLAFYCISLNLKERTKARSTTASRDGMHWSDRREHFSAILNPSIVVLLIIIVDDLVLGIPGRRNRFPL